MHFQRKRLLTRRRRWRQIPLNATKARIPLIVNRINAPQEHTTQNVEFLVSAGLDPAIGNAVVEVLECEIARFDLEQRVPDAECDFGQGREVVGRGEDPALLAGGFDRAGDGAVDLLAQGVGDEAEGCARVSYGFVARAVDLGAVDGGGAGVEQPGAAAIVDGRVSGCLALQGVGVDVSEGEETALGDVAEPNGEELGGGGDVVLQDHVFDGRVDWFGGDGVVSAEGEAEQAVAFVGHEGGAH